MTFLRHFERTKFPGSGKRYDGLHLIMSDVRSLLLLASLSMFSTTAVSRAQTALEQHTQKAEEGAQSAPTSGSNTAGEYPPVLGKDHRPITISGTVASGPVPFEDISAKAGLTGWKQTSGQPEKRFILEAIGSGVALLDYDDDGWLDIYLVNGSTQAALDGKQAAPRAALFHNNHDGTFTDVTAKAGVGNERWGFGAVVGDFDNDGWPDIYVTNFGKNRLYHNNHDGTFTDVAEKAGVELGGWSTGATWGDYDGDGRLDLFVPGYVKFDVKNPPDLSPSAKNLAF
jgi:enediyne biosynthesis protein E4